MNTRTLLLLLASSATLASCDGLFGGLYDLPAEGPRFGFVERDPDGLGGTVYIDATSYTRWTYIDLHHRTVDTASITQSQGEPPLWDLALHRYDVKTNGGAAAESPYDRPDLTGDIAALDFVCDSDSQVVIDMSTMMDGYLGYAPSPVNPVLSRWLDVNTSTMPPVYTLSNTVYILRLADGTAAALQFTGYTNDASAKGYVTMRYRYPIND